MKKSLLALIFLSVSMSLHSADAVVDWGTTHQSIRGFGASNAWAGSTISDTLADFFFRTDGSNLGISMLRIRIPDSNGGEVPSVQKALARNPALIVWGSPWSPQNTTWKSTGSLNSGCLISTYYQAYANYLTKYAKDLSVNNGINLFAVSMQNEPDWDTSGQYEMCTWTAEQMHQFVKNNFGPALQSSNPTVKLMMPESFGASLAMSNPTLNDAAAAQYVGIIGEHHYGLPGDEPHTPNPYPLAVSLGKEYWETEYFNNHLSGYDATMTEGLNTAREIHNSMTIAEYNAYHYWWFQGAVSTDTGGLLPAGCTTVSCAPKYAYTFGNFSKFIRPGYVRIDTGVNPSPGVYVSAYKNPATGDFAIVAINTNGSGTSQRFVLIGGMNPATVTPWLTDASNSLVQQSNAVVAAGAFTYTLPASSVITFYGNSGTVPTTPTFTPTVTPIPCSVVLDECEDNNTTNNWGGAWYNYVSNTSTILPSPFAMTAGGAPGSTAFCASMTGNIAAGAYGGMGCNLNSGGTGVDLTGYTGVEFYAKGTGSYWFQLTQSAITGSYFGMAVNVSSTSAWTKFTVRFPADLTQRYGGPDTLTLNAIIALQWTNNANGAMDLQIDSVKFLQSCGTPTNTPNFTATGSPSRTQTPVLTSSFTPTRTGTLTYTRTNTVTPSFTRTASPTFSRTSTPTYTATILLSSTSTPANTATRTATPSFTVTGTATRTPSPTSTVTGLPSQTNTQINTATRTPTGSFTVTPSFTNTPQGTLTNSPANTSTRTATPTYTRTVTFTPTVTYSVTRTFTATPLPSTTNTAGNTVTFTGTATRTATLTLTLTPSNTRTGTAVFTATPSRTETPDYSNTSSPTGTPPTSTATPTLTGTPSCTPTKTNTATGTGTPSFTATVTLTAAATLTGTPSATPAITASATPQGTVSNTPVNTLTATAQNTASSTASPAATYTFTHTVSFTPTASFTATRSVTPAGTFTATLSFTFSATFTGTSTFSATASFTVTSSRTGTPSCTATATKTLTRTAVPSATLTFTALPSATATLNPSTTLEVTEFAAVPNPFVYGNPEGLSFIFRATRPVESLSIDIYTPAFRHIRRINKQGINMQAGLVHIPVRALGTLASGTYYCVMKAGAAGMEASAKPSVLIILK